MQWLLQNGVIKVIKTPSRSFYPEDAGLLMSIEGGRATDYVLRLSKNVKRGLHSKALRGWRPNGGATGYLNIHTREGEKIITEDPERFGIVRKIFDHFLTGLYGVTKIREMATNEWGLRTRKQGRKGGKPLSMSHIYKILNDPFYYGYFEWTDPQTGMANLYKGNHKPMITQEEYRHVQMLLGRKGKPQPRTREFAFTGLLKCGECHSSITAEVKSQVICSNCKFKFSNINATSCSRCGTDILDMLNPKILNYTYYHCTKRLDKKCTQKSLRVEELEAQVADILKSITIDTELYNVVKDCFNKKSAESTESEKPIQQSLQLVIDDCNIKLANLNREFLSVQNSEHKIFTKEEYMEQKKMILDEKQLAENNLQGSKASNQSTQNMLVKLFDFCLTALELFKRTDIRAKRMVLSTIGSNLTILDKKLLVMKHFPFHQVEKIKEDKIDYSEHFEPEKRIEFQDYFPIYYRLSPIMLSEIEAIRTWIKQNNDFSIPNLNEEIDTS